MNRPRSMGHVGISLLLLGYRRKESGLASRGAFDTNGGALARFVG